MFYLMAMSGGKQVAMERSSDRQCSECVGTWRKEDGSQDSREIFGDRSRFPAAIHVDLLTSSISDHHHMGAIWVLICMLNLEMGKSKLVEMFLCLYKLTRSAPGCLYDEMCT